MHTWPQAAVILLTCFPEAFDYNSTRLSFSLEHACDPLRKQLHRKSNLVDGSQPDNKYTGHLPSAGVFCTSKLSRGLDNLKNSISRARLRPWNIQ